MVSKKTPPPGMVREAQATVERPIAPDEYKAVAQIMNIEAQIARIEKDRAALDAQISSLVAASRERHDALGIPFGVSISFDDDMIRYPAPPPERKEA